MDTQVHGDLDEVFEQRLDALLAELGVSEVVFGPLSQSENAPYRAYDRRNRKRTAVSDALRQHPDRVASIAPAVLAAIT